VKTRRSMSGSSQQPPCLTGVAAFCLASDACDSRHSSTNGAAIRLGSGQIHFVDLSVERSSADAEFFGGGRHVAVRRGKRLSNQSSFRLMQVQWAGLFAERLS
jgi:hypothetical protein